MSKILLILTELTLPDLRKLPPGAYRVGEGLPEDVAEMLEGNPSFAREIDEREATRHGGLRQAFGPVGGKPGNRVVPPGGASEATPVSGAPGDEKDGKATKPAASKK